VCFLQRQIQRGSTLRCPLSFPHGDKQGFSAEQTQEFREAFSLFDKKGDNRIRVGDLGTVLRALGQNPSEEDVKKIQAEVDSESKYLCCVCLIVCVCDSVCVIVWCVCARPY
jgi:Ca2+-binding EF-hand superfamily protein